jgi:Protein of unknown function (DUF4241)
VIRRARTADDGRPPPVWELTREEVVVRHRRRGDLTVVHHSLGTVHLPDGRVTVGDPSDPPVEPVARVAAGRYPVSLRVVRAGRGDERVAAALMRFVDDEPATFEAAAWVATDSAMAAIGAPAALAVLAAGDQPDALGEQLEATYRDTWQWASQPVGDHGDVALFSTGMGDGSYRLWIGRTREGTPACLLLDCGLLV